MIALALRVRTEREGHKASKQLFAFSILYLFLLFAMLLVDRMSGGLSSTFRMTIASVTMNDMQKPRSRASGSTEQQLAPGRTGRSPSRSRSAPSSW